MHISPGTVFLLYWWGNNLFSSNLGRCLQVLKHATQKSDFFLLALACSLCPPSLHPAVAYNWLSGTSSL